MFHIRNRDRPPDPAGLAIVLGLLIGVPGAAMAAAVAPKANVLSLLGVVLFFCGAFIVAFGIGMRFQGMIRQVRRILFRR